MKFATVLLGLVSLSHVGSAATPTTTGTFKPTAPGQCDISMKSVGGGGTFNDINKNSYIKVNGLTYVDSFVGKVGYRGFNLLQLDTNTCKGIDFDHFDTWASAPDSDRLTNYIYGIPDGTHILGVIIDGVLNALNAGAKAALKSIGVDMTGLVHLDKLVFHVVKGQPRKTIVKSSKAAEDDLLYEEKAGPCIVCQNNGFLRVNAAGTGFECQCIKIYSGLYCEKFSEAGCVEHYTATAKSLYAKKREA